MYELEHDIHMKPNFKLNVNSYSDDSLASSPMFYACRYYVFGLRKGKMRVGILSILFSDGD